jgi:hypothetical protein
VNNLTVIRPALRDSIKGGTLNYQITWTGSGIAPHKTFEYSLDSGSTWSTIDTFTTDLFVHNWNVPDTTSTKALVRITDQNNLRGVSGIFTIVSSKSLDSIMVARPALAEIITGGMQNYQITWTGTGLTSQKIFALSLDSGLTWKTIDTLSADVFTHSWNVPDTASTRAIIRITDHNGITGKSGVFTIKSSQTPAIIVVRPAAGETILGGTANYQIKFAGNGIAAQKTFEYSLDGGVTWHSIGTISSNAFSFAWPNVPDTTSTLAQLRITDGNGLVGKSGLFTIVSSKVPAVVVIHPELGEAIVEGTQNYQITWTGTGLTLQKTFELSLNGGLTWTTIGTISADVSTYSWNVPDTTSAQAIVRITDSNGITGRSGLFTISRESNSGSIVVVSPATGEVIAGGMANYEITFAATNTTPQKTFEYSLDGGAHWNLIGVINSDALSYFWASVPNVATTQALVRITDGNGVTGTSGLFTIALTGGVGSINSLTLSGLDNNNNIGNNQTLVINWTYTPDIGTSVEVEYSLDDMITWGHVATVQVSGSPSTLWATPLTGHYNPVFIRVTSSDGMTRTSEPFSIGSNAAVTSASQKDGYSLTNYPNPVSGETNISFVLPVASDVMLTISNELGSDVTNIGPQQFDAGMHSISFNASKLPEGVYGYTLRAGSTTLVGKMVVVK